MLSRTIPTFVFQANKAQERFKNGAYHSFHDTIFRMNRYNKNDLIMKLATALRRFFQNHEDYSFTLGPYIRAPLRCIW